MDIYICGDSTAASYDAKETPIVGWGQVLGEYLPGAAIFNHAMAGRSTKTFLEEGRLSRLDPLIAPGSLLIVQFGHNDESDKPERHTDPWTGYTSNLTAFVTFARDHGALPVLFTPICMRIWQDGVLQETHGEYPEAMRRAAEKLNVPLADMYRDSFQIVADAGEEGSKAFFLHLQPGEDPRFPEGKSDNAHTRMAGARQFARCAAQRLKEMGLVKAE